MEVTTLLLADYATRDQGGKFTLVGAGITELMARKIPFVHPLIFLFIRLQTSLNDVGKNKIGICIVGEQGPVFKSEGEVSVAKNQGAHEIPIPFQLVGLKFPSAGEYNIDILINGEIKRTSILHVRVVPPKQ